MWGSIARHGVRTMADEAEAGFFAADIVDEGLREHSISGAVKKDVVIQPSQLDESRWRLMMGYR